MRKLNSQFTTRFISEAGLSGLNSTYYGFVETDHYYCMAVAEGYDGEGGRESAKLAVDAAMEAFVRKPGMSGRRIRGCIKAAHKSLLEQSVRIRLKAGILLLVSDYTRFRYGVCGNVMLYGLRNGLAYHQSATHTLYQSMVDEKELLPDGEEAPAETTNLYHYLGGDGGTTVSGKIRLEDGDVLLAATEGFWGRVSKVEILDAFESFQSEEEFLGDLQELYMRASTDSVPCCCLAAVGIKKTYKENRALRKKLCIWGAVILLILLVGGTVLFFYVRGRQKKQGEVRETVALYEDTGDKYLTELNCLLAKTEYEKGAEEVKKLKKSGERLEKEQDFTGKINISSVLEAAEKAFDAQDYALARSEYKKALGMVREHAELSSMAEPIDRRLRLASTGIEIGNYIQNAALKEAEGDMEAAGILYSQAEAMLRIVDDPSRLQQVQLAKLRVKGQAEEQAKSQDKEARAKARDEVIIDADKTAAMDAVLSGDYEMALELYTKIRDSYIAMGDDDKAEETTQVILSLYRQARAAGSAGLAFIEEDKNEAMDAFLDGDVETALELYKKVRDAYLEMEDKEGAAEMEAMITVLEESAGDAGAGSSGEAEAGKGKTGPVPGPGMENPEEGAEGGPGAAQPGSAEKAAQAVNGPAAAVGRTQPARTAGGPGVAGQGGYPLGQVVGPMQKDALKATATQDYDGAIEAYKKIRDVYLGNGYMDLAAQADAVVSMLAELREEAVGGDTDG